MSGECDKCGEHALDCRCNKTSWEKEALEPIADEMNKYTCPRCEYCGTPKQPIISDKGMSFLRNCVCISPPIKED